MRKMLMSICAAVLALGLTVQDAEAKRLGGGTSRGLQRESVTQRQATPQPTPPVQHATPQAPASPTPTPVSPAPRRSWLGPIAGLAAGIGLAALFSHFGLGEGLANVAMLALLAMAAIFVFKLLFRRRSQPQPQFQHSQAPLQYAGVGGPHMAPPPQVGEPEAASRAAPPPAAGPARTIPAGFDAEGFVRVAKANFLRLQAAHDAGNLADIREFTTPEMFAEIKLDIDDRHGASQQTDVVTLDAELLEVVEEPGRHIASVRFHGLVREQENGTAQPFDEVWNLVKPADGSRGWAVAGIQQLN